ncbi:MAG: hydroxymethylbilane synthase, partial [Achromobacter piechaudii]
FPTLVVKPLRGNLDTRLGKLDKGEYDAIVLAAAGLQRLGLESRIRSLLDPADSLPAAGQGALGIEIRNDRDDMRAWLAPLISAATTSCVQAERAVSRKLGGSCQVPLAAFAEISGDTLSLRALVASPDGVRMVHTRRSGPVADAQALGEAAAQELLDAGAAAILQELLQADPRPD